MIFTEIGGAEDNSIVQALSTKLTESLYEVLSIGEINEIRLSFHIFPEDWDEEGPDGPVTSTLQMEMAREINRKKVSLSTKRLMDIVGSLAGLILCLPVFLVIAARHQADIPRAGPIPAGEAGAIRQEVHVPEIPLDVCQ